MDVQGVEQWLPVYPEDDGSEVAMQFVPSVQVSPVAQDWYGLSEAGAPVHPVEMQPVPSGQASPVAQA